MKTFYALAILALLTACNKPHEEAVLQTVEVKVPVVQFREPPPELKREPLVMPKWVVPADKSATSCLTSEGEKLLKAYVIDREARLNIWEESGFK